MKKVVLNILIMLGLAILVTIVMILGLKYQPDKIKDIIGLSAMLYVAIFVSTVAALGESRD